MNPSTNYETESMNAPREVKSLICWKSALAGLFVVFLVMTGLSALGMSLGGIGLYDGTTMQNAGLFAAIWFLASAVISLFVGSYFSSRISRVETGRVGSAQGLLVASIFFAFFVYQTASTVGFLGRTAGSAVAGTASVAAAGVAQATQSSAVNEIVEDSMGSVNVPPEKIQTVITGVATRLLNGNTEGAKVYLSRQTGVTEAEAQTRINELRAKIDAAAVQTREATAKALQAAGWSLLLMIVLGSVAAMVGGMLGSTQNARKPLRGRESVVVRSNNQYAPAR